MKKMAAVAIIAASMIACSQNDNKDQSTVTESTTTTNETMSDAEKRAKEIADSTRMLDKKLADPNDPSTPDSLK